jgi:putative endonuclease
MELIEKQINRLCRCRRVYIEVGGKTTMSWRVYLVRCADDSLYCGISKDLETRIAQHNAGKGAKYTRSRLPVKLVAASVELSRSDALKFEYAVKQQPASRKVDALKGRIDLQREK